jgi:arsenate reductase
MSNVLFLCTRNSADSILAESILRSVGKARFQAFSAGCQPAAAVSEQVLDFLRERQLPVEELRSKSWREFVGPQAPTLAFVITLSEHAAAFAAQQSWPGDPLLAHWTLDAEEDGPQGELSGWDIRDHFWVLSRRIKIFASLPHGKASRHSLEHRLHALENWQ